MAVEINEWVSDQSQDVDLSSLPDLHAGVPWVYAAHPRRWRVDTVKRRLLPDLIQISQAKGTSKQLSIYSRKGLTTQFKEEGWVVLEPEIYAETGKGKSYVQVVNVPGGVTYLPRWAETTPGSSLIESDVEGYDDFCAWLADSGHAPEPPRAYLRQMLSQARSRHAAYVRQAHTNPAMKALADEWAVAIEVLSEALAPNPKPKTKTTKNSKSDPEAE